MRIVLLPMRATYQTHIIRDHSNNAQRGVYIMKLLGIRKISKNKEIISGADLDHFKSNLKPVYLGVNNRNIKGSFKTIHKNHSPCWKALKASFIWLKKLYFMEMVAPSPCSQQLATGPYSKILIPTASIHPIIKLHFNIILPPKRRI